MGYKYTIVFMRNGKCDYSFDRQTNSLFKLLWWVFKLWKYKIIDIEIRRGFTPCDKCDTDWCDKSPNFRREQEDE